MYGADAPMYGDTTAGCWLAPTYCSVSAGTGDAAAAVPGDELDAISLEPPKRTPPRAAG